MSNTRTGKGMKYLRNVSDSAVFSLNFPVIAYYYSFEGKAFRIIEFEVISSVEEMYADPDNYLFYLDSTKKIIDSTGQEYLLNTMILIRFIILLNRHLPSILILSGIISGHGP
jgi:hypothetical protein